MRTAKQHLGLGLICSIVYFVLFLDPLDFWNYLKVSFLWLFLSAAADYDKGVGLPHRHILFHSIVLPMLFVGSFWTSNVTISLWIWSWHLLSDIFQDRGKQPVGGYLIHIPNFFAPIVSETMDCSFRRNTLTKNQTRLWLFLNGVTGIVLSIVLEMI